MLLRRYIEPQVRRDLEKKMVFIGGPRQVGKTTLATSLMPQGEFTYLNWDIDEQRTRILHKELKDTPLLIFDEIHKFRKWRNYLKGLYDAIKTGSIVPRKILVTGSARLDLYRFGGDSLQGRYHYIRLLPLTLAEISTGAAAKNSDLESLLRYGGFPEPFLSQSEDETMRWSREYHARLVRDEVRDLESVQDLGSIELLTHQLPNTVGSILSINSLREDLQVAHRTLSKWVCVLEKLYAVFRLSPFGDAKIRAVKKEQKLYFYDWTVISNEAARFENLVAIHLLKHVFWQEDAKGKNIELRYFRDTDGREVDFVIIENSKPTLFVECKLSDTSISKQLQYLCAKYPKVPAYQIHLRGNKDFVSPSGIRVCPAVSVLANWG